MSKLEQIKYWKNKIESIKKLKEKIPENSKNFDDRIYIYETLIKETERK